MRIAWSHDQFFNADVFQPDPLFLENEQKYQDIKTGLLCHSHRSPDHVDSSCHHAEILGAELSDGELEGSDDSDEDDDEEEEGSECLLFASKLC